MAIKRAYHRHRPPIELKSIPLPTERDGDGRIVDDLPGDKDGVLIGAIICVASGLVTIGACIAVCIWWLR